MYGLVLNTSDLYLEGNCIFVLISGIPLIDTEMDYPRTENGHLGVYFIDI